MKEQITIVVRINHLCETLVWNHPFLLQHLDLPLRNDASLEWCRDLLCKSGTRLRSLRLHIPLGYKDCARTKTLVNGLNPKRLEMLIIHGHIPEHLFHFFAALEFAESRQVVVLSQGCRGVERYVKNNVGTKLVFKLHPAVAMDRCSQCDKMECSQCTTMIKIDVGPGFVFVCFNCYWNIH